MLNAIIQNDKICIDMADLLLSMWDSIALLYMSNDALIGIC